MPRFDFGDICSPVEERPLSNRRKPLWADGDTITAYETTTAAWDFLNPLEYVHDDQGDIFVDGHKVDPFDWHGMEHLMSFNEDGTVVRVKED